MFTRLGVVNFKFMLVDFTPPLLNGSLFDNQLAQGFKKGLCIFWLMFRAVNNYFGLNFSLALP